MASVKYDYEAKALYFKLAKGKTKVKSTIPLGSDRFMDIDDKGKVVGFEMILSRTVSKEALHALKTSKDTIELIQ
ncbi:MAG: DUF2283 domain-containing protein [Nitrosotalea sp.]